MLPTALVVLLFVLAASFDGAFHLRQWGPAALLTLVTLLAMHLAGATSVPRGPLRVAVAAAWGYAAWTALSMLWAQSPGLAWEGANRTVLYAALVTLAVVTVAPARQLALVGHAVVAGISLLAVVTLLRMRARGQDLFLAGRLDSPVGYRNGTAALFAFPVWPLIVLAATRGRSAALRGGAFAWAVLCLGLAFVTQSRGVALGLGCGAVVALALGPDRLRRAWLALLSVGFVAVVAGPLLEPYDKFTGTGDPASVSAISHAANALTAVTIGAFVVAFLIALADNGLRAPQLARFGSFARVAMACVVLFGGAAVLVHIGNPVSYVNRKVNEFKDLTPTSVGGATRLGSVGGQRYDLWRVGLNEWSANPVGGVGEGNYAFDYYVKRRTDRNLTDPHSLPVRILAETGFVGFGLVLLFLACLVAALARGWRRVGDEVRRPAVALAAAGAVVIGQNTVDWLWLIPGLTGLGLFTAALAASMVAREASGASGASGADAAGAVAPARTRRVRWALGVAGLVVACLAVLTLFLSDVRLRRAQSEAAAASPAAALADARAALSLDPWNVEARWAQAGALETMGRHPAARAELLRALSMEPRNFGTLGLLGDFEARAGNGASARAYYARALALDPRDVGLQKLARGQISGG